MAAAAFTGSPLARLRGDDSQRAPHLTEPRGSLLTPPVTSLWSFASHSGASKEGDTAMDMKLELVAIPVTDVDRAKAFYIDKVGFHADHDHTVSDQIRFVQLTPPGSACSIAIGKGLTTAV